MKDLTLNQKQFLIGLVVEDIDRLILVIEDLNLDDELDLRAYVHHKENAFYSIRLLNSMYQGSISKLYELNVISIDTAQRVERFIENNKGEIEV